MRVLYLGLILVLVIVGFCLAFFPDHYVAAANWWLRKTGGNILSQERFHKTSQRISGFILFAFALAMLWGSFRDLVR